MARALTVAEVIEQLEQLPDYWLCDIAEVLVEQRATWNNNQRLDASTRVVLSRG